MQDYRQLKVWEKAHSFALEVHRVSGKFSRQSGVALISQLRRAAFSIPTNIAEGAARTSDLEFRRFLRIAMASATEADYHLLVAMETKELDPRTYDDLAARGVEIRRMLGGLIKRINATLNEGAPPPDSSLN
jgi:four helix bundle protein